ncbi:MAG: magnesium transporter MgtC [Cytophagaceae bacterium]|nr:magnesium transporter MgtC [Cytophagaceae bacterium]|tara:strand:+ start:745 stop:1188 length:444 start_codon:yes stop_codon:yes gene_type:complete
MTGQETITFAINLLCAIGAGLFIGLEREFKDKNAGLKTNMLVAVGAAVFVMISLKFQGEEYADMTRVLSQVLIGVGFLGAGTIIKTGESSVKGLTTAATIWCSAAAGCLAAMGMYWDLLMLTVAVIIINRIFGWIESKFIEEPDDNT